MKFVIGALAISVILIPAVLAVLGRARVRSCCPADPTLDTRMNPSGERVRG